MSKLIWYGERISKRIREASRAAVDETMAAAAGDAEGHFPRQTGKSAESIKVLQHAAWDGRRTRGTWGSKWFLVYIFEVGSFRHRQGWWIRNAPKGGKRVLASKERIFGRRVKHPPIPAYATLRHAADRNYPSLVGRIRRRLAA